MCTTNDAALAERMRSCACTAGAEVPPRLIGGNFRLDEIQAAVLNVKLAPGWLDGGRHQRRQYTAAFCPRGPPTVATAGARPGRRHVWNQYVIRVQRRDELRQHLAAAGIGTEIYYPMPLHLQQCFAYLGHRGGDFPLSERAAGECLALPVFPELAGPNRLRGRYNRALTT